MWYSQKTGVLNLREAKKFRKTFSFPKKRPFKLEFETKIKIQALRSTVSGIRPLSCSERRIY